jgi:hypothetical protein
MIYLIHVSRLIINGKVLLKIELFGKLLIQSIGQEVRFTFIDLAIDFIQFVGQWDSNIPLEETKIDEDDCISFVRTISFSY